MKTAKSDAAEKSPAGLLSRHFAGKGKKANPPRGKNCFIYCRVSSKDHAENGNSLQWQKKAIGQYAKEKGWYIGGEFGGTYESAKTDDRKEFNRLIKEAKAHKDISAIIVYSYDRFSRTGASGMGILDDLKRRGIRLIAVTQDVDSSSPQGTFQQNIHMIFSNYDNEQRREKSVKGIVEMLRNGYWPHPLPLGYDNLNKYHTADRHKYVVNEKGKLVKTLFTLKAGGKLSNKEIISVLQAKGLTVNEKSFLWVLKNPFYCGFIVSKHLPDEIIAGKHPAIIDVETFLRANEIHLENPRSGVPKQHKQDPLPLKVFAMDEKSNIPFTGYLNRKKNIYYYKTRGAGAAVNVSAAKLNSLFGQLLQNV